ncbi:multicopper oxidase family protein [Granulicella arctica]|uniref:FtsP/CotA-like multicopper oxidase with cupredoxin domain n=1 Tax=Granulicella arctica TaxID=940613 RepID=A0A7Y9PJ34_9BACT|nr:multicopper oxidase domain-containing protein [Granulicella arctica]NYF80013.1 FtsP/CotA-like multicopper oxidase with cupredoxin domain [Granulicella arctica]
MVLALYLVCRAALADRDEYTGLAWNPTSTPSHPCGIGLPPRGNFAHDRWVNARKPRVSLVVRQEGTTLCYVIDGVAEAPTIRVKQGATLTVTLRNEITDPSVLGKLLPPIVLRDRPVEAVPDRVGVVAVIPGQFHVPTGRTNLHMHGFAVPPTAPQDEVLMGCADPAVGDTGCGQREITYQYQIPPNMPPGLYWYHPHVHGEVQAQMLAGLTGAIVVEGPDDEAREAAGIEDRVFIVRQLRDSDSKNPAMLIPPTDHRTNMNDTMPMVQRAMPHAEHATESSVKTGGEIDTSHELGCANAAALDEITLNGAPVVDGEVADKDLAPLHITVGTTQLWRVVNAATDAVLDLALIDEAGKPVPVRIIARDGAPLTNDAGRPVKLVATTAAQSVPPAGRVEFLVTAPKLGTKIYFVTHAVDTGCAGDVVPERRLGILTSLPYTDDAAQPPISDAPRSTVPDLFSGLLARKTDRTRVLAFAEYPRPGDSDQTDFYIVERRQGAVLKPYEMSDPPAINVAAGSVEEWTIENWTREIHAFHIHQVHFRLLGVNGLQQDDPPLLDTVIVPAAVGFDRVDPPSGPTPGTVRIKIYFPETMTGDIPFHCHLVDHEDNGMMGVLRVLPSTVTNNSSVVGKTHPREISFHKLASPQP